MTKEEIYNSIRNLHTEYFNTIKSLVENEIGEGWTLVALNDTSLRVGFQIGVWEKSQEPRYQELDMYHGYDWDWSRELGEYHTKFRFEMNVGAMGSFDMLNVGEAHTYYSGIGRILNNTEFLLDLKNLLKKFADDRKPLSEELREIERAEDKAKREKIEAERKEAQEKFLAKCDEKIKNGAQYCVIHKGGNFNEKTHIYRRKEVGLIFVGDYSQCHSLAFANNRHNYRIDGEYWQCVEVSKIKKIK